MGFNYSINIDNYGIKTMKLIIRFDEIKENKESDLFSELIRKVNGILSRLGNEKVIEIIGGYKEINDTMKIYKKYKA